MKYSLHFILIILLCLGLAPFTPWWSVMLAGLLAGLIVPLKKSAAFFIPFFSVGLYWLVYAWWLTSQNDFLMAKRIAELLPLEGSTTLLLVISALIGGLAAGFSSLSGSLLSQNLRGSGPRRRPLARS